MKLRLLCGIVCMLFLLPVKGQLLEASDFAAVAGIGNKGMVYCIMQDRTGYIWLGTDAGVIRYDGNEARTFTTEDGLSDNEVLQIKEDTKGRLWFLTYNGRLSYYEHGRIYSAAQIPFLQRVAAGSISVGWLQQGDSTWYVTRRKAYLFVRDQWRCEWSAEELFPDAPTGFSEVCAYGQRFRLLSSKGTYDPVTGKYERFPDQAVMLPVNKVILHGEDIYYYAGHTIYQYDTRKKQFITSAVPGGGQINAWYYREKDTSIVLTTQQAAYRFRLSDASFEKLLHLPTPYSSYVFEDREQNKWLGTFHQGVWLHRNLSAHLFTPHTGLGTREAYSVGLLNGVVYAGYLNGEYLEWKAGEAHWRRSSQPAGFHRSYGFAHLGRQLYSLSGQQLINVQTGKSTLFPGSVKALAVQEDSAYVALSFHVAAMPLNILFRGEKEALLYVKKSKTIYDKRAYCLLMSADTLWLGSEEGICYYTGNGKARLLTAMPLHMRRKVTRLFLTTGGQLIAATAGGGLVVRDGSTWHSITVDQGLISNNCNNFFVAGDSILWLASDKGLSKIDLTAPVAQWQSSIQNYTGKDGLPAANINSVLLKEDTIWMATPQGVAYIRQPELRQQQAPPVTIETLLVNGKQLDRLSGHTLSHSNNNIRVDFTVLSFPVPAIRHFAYRLEGVDNSWSKTSARQIHFSNLAPGSYTFQITAGDPADAAATISSLKFRILPPFWQRPLFLLTAAILAGCMAAWIIRTRLHSLQKKNELERRTLQLMKEKAELEQTAAAMQMNPHFLFNALNTIKGYYSSGSRLDGDNYTSKLAGLMRLMLENNARPSISLRDEIDMLQLYLGLMCEQRTRKFSFTIATAEWIAPDQVWMPPMLVQPFVENAIVHGIAPLSGGGRVHISFRLNEATEMLTCEVLDNGVGLQRSAMMNKFRIHDSKGIAITRQRLQLISAQSRLSVTEVYDEAGETTGTRVLIDIPVKLKTHQHAYGHH